MTDRTDFWQALERWSSTAFLLGGLLMVIDVGFVAANVTTGAERYLIQGQAFVGAAWTAALLGLLGLYPGLSDRSRWLSRVGAACAAIGVVTFTVMTVAVLGYTAGLLEVDFDAIGVLFIPGVLIGSVLGFVLFGVASLRTGVRSRTVSLLLFLPAAFVLANFLRFVVGMTSSTGTLVIVIGDALAMLALGFVLRAASTRASHATTTESMT